MTKPPHAGDAAARLRSIPEASVARLAVYLRKLGELAEEGAETVSSDELAATTGVNPAKLRKDLSYIGSYGIRGVGYEVAALVHQLERTLGLNHRQAVALVGIGNLGHAGAASRSRRCSTSTPTSSGSASTASSWSTSARSPRSAPSAASPSG